MKNFITLILFFCISFRVFGGELFDYYQNQATKKRPDVFYGQFNLTPPTNHGVSEIGIERTGCYGKCPSYTFIAKSNGSFVYVGERYTERLGKFTGTISKWRFSRLAQFIKDSDYGQLQDGYRAKVTDMPTVYTSAVLNGERKVIMDYGGAGPAQLWAVEQLIDDLICDIDWTKAKKLEEKKK